MDLKTQKYDRQLRLWAASGQSALETASICLLNASATGCETLKNLILPGVGNVTIVDNDIVSQDDVHSNFFVAADNVSQPKAEAAAKLLQELNIDVNVSGIVEAPQELIQHKPDFFEKFTMVIATNLHESDTLLLAGICQRLGLTLFVVQCKGLCGVFRLQAPEHSVIETHPQNAVDLRLGAPFQLLEEYAATFDLDSMDQTDHAHVPYVVVTLAYLQQWKKEHEGKPPQTYQERNELKKMIKSGMRTPDEENFEEAINNLWRVSAGNDVPQSVRNIFDDAACTDVNVNSDHFWVIARAIRDFVDNEGAGQLPLSGKLPDMKSSTDNYVGLQNTYRSKSLEDLEVVKRRVSELLAGFEASPETIPTEMIESFCKNAAHIQLLRFRTFEEQSSNPNTSAIVSLLQGLQEDDNIAYCIVFGAADRFYTEHQRYPGTTPDIDTDVKLLRAKVIDMLNDIRMASEDASAMASSDQFTKVITNYVRFCDKETANLAGLVGGLVAQEAIKMITHQYTPINNVCVFNGIRSTSSVIQL